MASQTRSEYVKLVHGLQNGSSGIVTATPQSALVTLLRELFEAWGRVAKSQSREDFLRWLETANTASDKPGDDRTLGLLDTLDDFLLSAVVELEMLANRELEPLELEHKLKELWQHTYARYATTEERRLREIFVRRGRALQSRIYSSPEERRRIYRTSLPPRAASRLIGKYDEIVEHLRLGASYAYWQIPERRIYMEDLVRLLADALGLRLDTVWRSQLGWWLVPTFAKNPRPNEIGLTPIQMTR
jgi:hypothetical protein